MGQVLCGLEERGLIRREQDPNNRRILLISPTDTGRALASRCSEAIDRIEEETFSHLEPADIVRLRATLRGISHAVRHGPAASIAPPSPIPQP